MTLKANVWLQVILRINNNSDAPYFKFSDFIYTLRDSIVYSSIFYLIR